MQNLRNWSMEIPDLSQVTAEGDWHRQEMKLILHLQDGVGQPIL